MNICTVRSLFLLYFIDIKQRGIPVISTIPNMNNFFSSCNHVTCLGIKTWINYTLMQIWCFWVEKSALNSESCSKNVKTCREIVELLKSHPPIEISTKKAR